MKQKIRSLLLFFIIIIFVVTLSFAVLLVGQGITAFADSSDNYSDSYENIEDCIEKDSVIITLTENETMKYKTYTANDFKEVGCVEIEDLTQCTTNAVKEIASGDSTGESMLVETENYKKILKLTLNKLGADNVVNAIETLNKREDVLEAGPNYVYTIASTPNDYYWEMDGMWGLREKGIKADSAWDITTGVSTITVGVLDGGIEANHPDLVNRISMEGLHRDCTVDPIATVSNADLNDPTGHGTHVAGIIGAQGNNSIGVSGVCWDIRLVSLRVLDENGNGSTANLAIAIDYAASKNIPILNCSAVGPVNDKNLRNALENYKGLFVCSAGNDGGDNDKTRRYPSDYSYNQTFSDRVISVGALNRGDSRYIESNYGENSVSIFAPGSNILSTYPTKICDKGNCDKSVHLANGYHYKNGTSMAAPFVTGVAALLLSKDSTLTAAELKQVILDSADEIPINIPSDTKEVKEINVKKLNAYEALKFDKVTFDKQGGKGGTDYVIVKQGEAMPAATAPTRDGYRFSGYYSKDGVMYYDSNMKSVRKWDRLEDTTLRAEWSKIYTIKFKMEGDTKGEYSFEKEVCYGDKWPSITMPFREGYYVSQYNYQGASLSLYYYYLNDIRPRYDTFTYTEDIELVGSWAANTYTVYVSYIHWYSNAASPMGGYQYRYNETFTYTANESMTIWVDDLGRDDTRLFSFWGVIQGGEADYNKDTNPWHTISKERSLKVNLSELIHTYYPDLKNNVIIEFRATYSETPPKDSCVAEGTLITLADGKQVPVEQLTGNEMLLVWNFYTGTFDTAPILFIDHDDEAMYEVIKLSFSDGTTVEVIYEHAFWDFDLNEYVFLRSDAEQYIGHWFNKQIIDEDGQPAWRKVQLTDVQIQQKYTSAWSPVTYGHLCYYVNGMLSMPGATEGLINIFDVDGETMKYDEEKMLEDINEFGLFTYEEFNEIIPVPEEVFNAFGGQYLKVSIGKGLIDYDTISQLISRYSMFF